MLRAEGAERAHFLLERLIDYTRRSGAYLPFKPNTAYVNTISTGQEPAYPGDRALERRIEAYIRWNALAMVVQANRKISRIRRPHRQLRLRGDALRGGFQPLLACASATSIRATWCSCRATRSPGIYARAYLEGRLSEEQLQRFRQEVGGGGLSSYPHPWLMPDFWQFPTVSMGLGPDDGDLPGALHPLPRAPRPRPRPRTARSGRSAATARWTSRSRWAR